MYFAKEVSRLHLVQIYCPASIPLMRQKHAGCDRSASKFLYFDIRGLGKRLNGGSR